MIRDSDHDDTILWDGTFTNSFGEFIEVRLGKGDDILDFTGATSGTRRVSYENATGGVNIVMTGGGDGTATDNSPVGNHIGTDTITNATYLRGSKYDDYLEGDGQTTRYRGSAGNDTIVGDASVASQNQIDHSNSPGGINVDLSLGSNQVVDDGFGTTDDLTNIRRVDGSIFDDHITGDGNANRLRGNGGDDTLIGGGGNDILIGDFGDDLDPETGGTIILGGDDYLDGGAGNDTLEGGAGNDVIVGGQGDDNIDGGDDSEFGVRQTFDTLDYGAETGGGAVTVNLATGTATDTFGDTDTITGIERVIGTSGNDVLTGGNTDNDDYEEFNGRGGNDSIDGGSGFDRASYQDAAGAITVNMALGSNQVTDDGDGGVDDLSNIEAIEGSQFSDTIAASNNMWVRGRAGADDISASSGTIRVDYSNSGAVMGVTVNLSAGSIVSAVNGATVDAGEALDGTSLAGGDTDTLSGVGRVRGSQFGDHLVGGAADEIFQGLDGDDTIDGGGGTNTVLFDDFGQSRFARGIADSGVNVDLSAGTAVDAWGDTDTLTNIQNVVGTAFADRITGDGSDNVIDLGSAPQAFFDDGDFADGGDGDDVLKSSGGFALLIGGAGADDFQFSDTGQYFDWINVSYATSSGNVFANFTNAGIVASAAYGSLTIASGEVLDGINGDTAFGSMDTFSTASGNAFHVFRDSPNDDQFHWDGTYTDRFGEVAGPNDFIEVRLSDGDDVVDFTNATGTRRISYQNAAGGVNIDMTFSGTPGTGQATDNGGSVIGTDTLVNVTYLRGSLYDDVLTGDSQARFFRGSAGNDTIIGDAASFNRVDHSDSPDGIEVDLALGANQVIDDGYGTSDTLTNIDNVRGSDFDDLIAGNSNDNTLLGARGDDELEGGDGDDFLGGDEGDDILFGGDGDDELEGNDGDDTLDGGDGNDYLIGGDGSDILIGGDDVDPATGQRGTFDFVDYRSEGGGAGVTVDLSKGTATDTFGNDEFIAGVEVINGTDEDDTLIGGYAGNDEFEDFAVTAATTTSTAARVSIGYVTRAPQPASSSTCRMRQKRFRARASSPAMPMTGLAVTTPCSISDRSSVPATVTS